MRGVRSERLLPCARTIIRLLRWVQQWRRRGRVRRLSHDKDLSNQTTQHRKGSKIG